MTAHRPSRRPAAALVCALAALLAPACVVTETTGPARPEPPEVVVALPIAAWRVGPEGAPEGYLVRFEPPLSEDGFFSVRNPWQQELGLIDAQGRFWRFEPHATEPSLVGSGTVAQGVARLLGLEAEPELVPIPLAALGG